MKQSSKIYGDLQAKLQHIRELNAEAEKCQPIRKQWRLSAAEEKENFRRANRLDQIIAELAREHIDEVRLRKSYSDAMAAEQAPPPEGPSAALVALYVQRDDLTARLDDLRDVRSKHALSGAEGDKKAKAALAKAVEDHAAGEIELANLNLAIEQAESRDAEVKREFVERDADAKYQAGLAAAEPLVEWAFEFDRHLTALSAHYEKLPALRKALAKSGADINTDMTNRLFIKAAHDRAAKAQGLHHIFNIDATVTGAPLGETFKSLLKAAVRRPTIERKIAS